MSAEETASNGSDPQEIKRLFDEGDLTRAAGRLAAIEPQTLATGVERDQVLVLFLAVAALGYVTAETLRAWLQFIPENLRPELRYRALIACGLWTQAAQLRRQSRESGDPAFPSQCRLAMALALLKKHKRRLGFRFYKHRIEPIGEYNRHILRVLDYKPAFEQPANTVFLEQGVGDRFLHLAHIKGHHPGIRLSFAVVERWKALVQSLFPGDAVTDLPSDVPQERAVANASGDYLVKAFQATGSIAPAVRLGRPYRHGSARFGLVWRGGSAQNKREERRIPLESLLGLLPDDIELTALQPKLPAEEERLILRHDNAMLPAFDLTKDLGLYASTIAGLAGVIGVDNTTVHVAGVFGVPSYTLMNESAHWYWGPNKQVSALYPDAETDSLELPDKTALDEWVRRCLSAYDKRPNRGQEGA
ncbi:MAG: hypothetical protein MI862_27550 [Desulfobacterales bacterium]|nr:hypothetical protein [Desulfobacterales bacterium]